MADEIIQVFRESDIDGDGCISRGELGALLRMIMANPFSDKQIDALLEEADMNKDGRLDYAEFVQWLFQASAQSDLNDYLPGKTEESRGKATLTGELARMWGELAKEIQASHVEWSKLESEGAFRGISWSSSIPVPAAYWKRGAAVKKTEFRAIMLSQLNGLAALVHKVFQEMEYRDRFSGQVVTWDSVNLYHINEHIVMPMTARFKCSFVDLVASGEQRPVWFVSHWWGTPFRETISLLNWHSKCRNLTTAVTYWICTFANNQHQLDELAGGLLDTPFVKAITSPSCVGTCALFDSKATTFSRIWCVLEGHFSTMEVKRSKPEYMYDLAGMLVRGFKGACLRMDVGNGESDEYCEGNTVFPGIISKAAVQMNVQHAHASVEADKRLILHHIVGTPVEKQSEEPPKEHPRYEELNHFMRGGFAGPAIMKAINEADAGGIQSILEEFPEALYFESKRAGSIWDVAHRRKTDPKVTAVIEAAFRKAKKA